MTPTTPSDVAPEEDRYERHPMAEYEEQAIVARPAQGDVSTIAIVGSIQPKKLLDDVGIECVPPDGRLLSIDDYPELYSVIGRKYGSDREPGFFRVPDLRGRVVSPASPTTPGVGSVPLGMVPFLPIHSHKKGEVCTSWCAVKQWRAYRERWGDPTSQVREVKPRPPHVEANGEHSVAAELRLKTTSRGMQAYLVTAPGRDHEAAMQWARYADAVTGTCSLQIATDEQVTPSPAERRIASALAVFESLVTDREYQVPELRSDARALLEDFALWLTGPDARYGASKLVDNFQEDTGRTQLSYVGITLLREIEGRLKGET